MIARTLRWIVPLCALLPTGRGMAVEVELAREGKALLPVSVEAAAGEETRRVAGQLAGMLGRITGGAFLVVTNAPGPAIRVGTGGEFGAGPLDREDYRLLTSTHGVHLTGATELAVSHAVWDFLHRLGYRQFFPGEAWEVVPSAPDLRVELDARERPAFHARRIWYNWGFWGYNTATYADWCARNRMAKGFDLNSGHAYDAIIAAHRAEFLAHPDYLAEIGGKRELRPDAKFCVASPGLRELVVRHAVDHFRRNPRADSISMDPSDGGGWCECAGCAAVGSPSDRVVTLANAVAEACSNLGLGPKFVGIYAYNRHTAPPSIRVHPHVIPSATTSFIGGGFTFDQVVSGWQKQGATMGCYDYLSVVDWDWNMPRGGKGARVHQLAAFFPRLHAQGVRFYDAEAGDCWGPCGLGYYLASRMLWNTNEAARVPALIDDFVDRAFGSAREPMREFYRLLNEDHQLRPASDFTGRLYRLLDQARQRSDDPRVRTRLDHLTLYARHTELQAARAAGTGSAEAVARHAYRMRATGMVHSYGLWARLVSQKAAHEAGHPWKDERPFSADEIAALTREGIARNVPADPGFTGVEFSATLVPAAPLRLPSVPAGRFPNEGQDHQRYHLWMAEGAGGVDLKVTVRKVWANRLPKLTLISPAEVSLEPVAVFDQHRPDGQTRAVRLVSAHAGLHTLDSVDGGDFTRIDWPENQIVTVESGIASPAVKSQFRGVWTLYAYVPKGTAVIGGWSSRVENWAPRPAGRLVDPTGRVALNFADLEEGWFRAEVPPGQDGKLWKFDQCVGQRLLMTIPPYLARRAEELLLPAEVVERDAAGER